MRPSGSIRARSNGTFEISYSLGTDPLTGKRKRNFLTFVGSRHQADRELRRILRTVDTGEFIEPNRMKVDEFLLQWLETKRSQLSPKTHERYTQIVLYYLNPTFGGCFLTKLTPMSIQQAYNEWETKPRYGADTRPLAARTRLHIHRTFKLALRHATKMRLIVYNPADDATAPKIGKTTITTLTVEQSAVLLSSLETKSIYWPVMLALATGMRRGEVLALRWKNVDLEKRTVRVVESLEQTKKGIRFKAPKTERGRAVLLPSYAVQELTRLKDQQEAALAELEIPVTPETLVITRSDGTPTWPSSITHEFIKAMRKLPDLPRVRFHDLRHSHATQMLGAGIHPKIAQERLGHSTIATTLDLYSHATDTMQDEAAMKLDSLFRAAIKPRLSGPKLG